MHAPGQVSGAYSPVVIINANAMQKIRWLEQSH